MHDWASLRAAAIRFADSPRDFDPALDRMKLKDLWSISEMLHARSMDAAAERALLRFIATRVLGGSEFDRTLSELLIERLLHADLVEPAREFVSRLDDNTWRKHVLGVELEHPRFGGSYEDLLLALNTAFHRFGLERISITGGNGTPLERLQAETQSIAQPGPLVSVVLSTSEPTAATYSAVRSIVQQTYQDWELIVAGDASAGQSLSWFERIAELDPRVRILRLEPSGGTYVGHNEALRVARGEFITFQDEHAWSHPRRIETQVRDLAADADKLANIVRKALVSDDFSLVGARGAKLVLSESSLLFRREEALGLIGFFDAVHNGAATEFRRRLEAATGTKVGFVGPEVPFEFSSASNAGDAQADYEIGMWIDPEWLAYRETYSRFHNRIQSGELSPYVAGQPVGLEDRPFPAPARWSIDPTPKTTVDVLLVMDGQRSQARTEFIDAVVDELYVLVANGVRVALLHSESVEGADRPGPIADSLQELVDSGRVTRVFDHDEVEANVVIIRHAVSVQGHEGLARPVNAGRVVVVEDIAGGDLRGETFAQADVDDTVTDWFGIEPEWIVAAELPHRPVLRSAVVEDESVRVTVVTPDPRQVVAVRFGGGSAPQDFPVIIDDEDNVVASAPLSSLAEGELMLSVVRGEGANESVQGCQVEPRKVLSARTDRLLIAKDRVLRLLPKATDDVSMGGVEFANRYLCAEVTLARIFRDQVELTVRSGGDTKIVALHFLREVNGHIRRHELTLEEAHDGVFRAIRALDGVLDTRWKIFAVFQTPLGPVSAPVKFNQETLSQDSEQYRIRKLSSSGVGIIHIVEQARNASTDDEPTLSVVMPVFNVAPFLDTAIQSVLMQDFEDFELIIVDDASTDGGRQVIEMHRALDDRIRVIELDHNTLGGAGVPSNLGIRAARGKYIGFVDSDDWVTKSGFAKLVSLADTHDAELVVGDFRTFDENDRTVSDAYDAERWRHIPLERVISASSHPALMRLSPVPWRKLYRRDFVEAHHVLYPEGDYFYEDNPLHWHVLSRAQRVVASDEIVSYHRMAREGQTMGAHEYKLGAIASHANTTLQSLRTSTAEHREVLFEEFVDYVSRQRWTVRRQTQPAAAKMIQHRLADIYDRAREAEPGAYVPQPTVSHFAGYRRAYPNVDLTIVIPVYNSADLIGETLESVLKLDGLSYDVLLIDDGSTDDSLQILREYEKRHDNVHVFEQKNRGAGRARNAVIPLTTGRYTFFLDADDLIDANALRQAVHKADQDDADLLFVQYRIEYKDENRSRGMFNADADLWQQLQTVTDNGARQHLCAGLINYPWNRIIRTSLLHDANIFFGPTIVHNDVLFHWHSILSATRISSLDVEVCTHRKFSHRSQVTNINDERRMAVLEALRGTHERISDLETYSVARSQWERFAQDLLDWAGSRIPPQLQGAYAQRSADLKQVILAESQTEPAGIDSVIPFGAEPALYPRSGERI
ncbi:glycosyltransferase family 2 protein [Brevibacterium casei]|uniref:glycosyltransferase family 2 protein n=1 Tax=Brevibacterium casei TaxID=33889 RepID=UPI003F7DBC48